MERTESIRVPELILLSIEYGGDVPGLAHHSLSRFRAGVRALPARLMSVWHARAGAPTVRPGVSAAPALPPPLPSAATVITYGSLAEYVQTIDELTRTRPDLAAIRAYNHAMVDVVADTVSLVGLTLLDVGASPHGFSLERTLAKGAAYFGVGLGMWEPAVVIAEGAIGRLVAARGEALPLASESIDVAMSLSTFEHFLDGPAVLREIHRVLRPGGTFFVSFEPVWTSAAGHHLHHLGDLGRLIPPWAHLLWTPARMRRALADHWPAGAPLSLEEAVTWVYYSQEINRVDVVALRRMFESGPFQIEWIAPLPEDEGGDKPQVAAYLATVLPYSREDLLTRGFSIMMRKT